MSPCRFSTTAFVALLVLVIALLAVIGGCLPLENRETKTPAVSFRSSHHTARLNVFLTLEDQQGPSIQLEIANLEVLAEEGWLQIASGPMTIDSVEIGKGQFYMGGMAVPPGHYKRLRLTVTKGSLRKVDGQVAITMVEPQRVELTLAKEMPLDVGDSKTLLFTWDVENSVQPDKGLSPQFFAAPALRQLPFKLIFVACPDIDTVYVVSISNNWVVDSFGVKGRPTHLAIAPSTSLERLFVLTPDEKKVKVIDMSSLQVIDSYPTLDDEVTYMTISNDGQWAYLLQERSGYVSRMNLQTGQIGPRVMVGSRPNYVAYLDQQKLLAVSLTLYQKILLLNPESLRTVSTLSTGSRPEGILVSDNQLYIAERDADTVSKNDLSNRSVQSRFQVGMGPRRLADGGDQIFISNYSSGSISAILPDQFGAVQEIFGLGLPLEMVFDPFYRRLYVADEQDNALVVIDANTNQLVGHISLGAKPVGLVNIK